YALEFLNQAPPNQPFLLYFAPNAPHHPADPAPEDEELYAGLPRHRPPSFNEPDASGKPAWLQNNPPLNNRQVAVSDDFRLLHPGDILLVFTDGISEAINHQEEEFGEVRLAQLVVDHIYLSAVELRDLILTEIAVFVGEAPQHDDMTLLIAKVL